MKKIFLTTILIILPLMSVFAQDKKLPELTTVPKVDLQKYAGTWYEIAKYPNRFQKKCVGNTTATYNLKSNGNIEVLNKCLKKDGQVLDAKGKAKIVDKNTNAKLKVSFFLFFYAPYWVIDLDENYQYAVIGEPGRDYLWILSRQPKIDDATYQNILRKVETMGYNPAKLEKTKQGLETIKGSIVAE